jgi:hypothetical protein
MQIACKIYLKSFQTNYYRPNDWFLSDLLQEMMELVEGDKDALDKPDILLLQQSLLQLGNYSLLSAAL